MGPSDGPISLAPAARDLLAASVPSLELCASTAQAAGALKLVVAFLPKNFQGRDPLLAKISDDELSELITALAPSSRNGSGRKSSESGPAEQETGGTAG
jgi:hypothetical protein